MFIGLMGICARLVSRGYTYGKRRCAPVAVVAILLVLTSTQSFATSTCKDSLYSQSEGKKVDIDKFLGRELDLLPQKLGLEPGEEVRFVREQSLGQLEDLKRDVLYKVKRDGTTERLGEVTYGPEQDTPYVLSFSLNVTYRYMRMGISAILAAKALSEYPQTTRIRNGLDETNLMVYFRSRAKGMTPEAALRETPAYKIRSKLGFTIDFGNSVLPRFPGSSVIVESVRN